MWNLGLGEPYAVSALHGRGSGDLLDAILDVAAARARARPTRRSAGPRRVAIVGKPNVGKSSLLNKLAGRQRVVVDDAAGTTVDPVDELVEVDGEIYRFIDTAGIRRRVKEASGHEYYASLRTHGAIERAEVCVVVIDASEPVTEQDLRILTSVEEAGRALVIAFNKWDLTDEERRRYLDPGDRARPGAVRLGGPGQHLRDHRPARRPAAAGARRGAGQLGDPDLDRQAERVPRPDRRRASAPGPGRQAAADPVRHPGPVGSADLRALHLRPDRGRATSASSSAGCARSSASPGPRCTCRSGPGRSAARRAADPLAAWPPAPACRRS